MSSTSVADSRKKEEAQPYIEDQKTSVAADPLVRYMSKEQLLGLIEKNKKEIEKAVKELDFIEAARIRDEIIALENLVKEQKT